MGSRQAKCQLDRCVRVEMKPDTTNTSTIPLKEIVRLATRQSRVVMEAREVTNATCRRKLKKPGHKVRRSSTVEI